MEVAHPQSGSPYTWFLVELEVGNVGFGGEGNTRVPGEKPLGARERTNNKLNPHMASTPGFEPRAALLGGERSHHCAIPSSPMKQWQIDFEPRIKLSQIIYMLHFRAKVLEMSAFLLGRDWLRQQLQKVFMY